MLFRSLALAALASLVAADGARILASLAVIDQDTAKLNASILAFDGNFFLSVPILGDNIGLNADLDNGTKTAQNSTALTQDEAIALVGPVQVLAGDVNVTVTNLIAKYPQFKQNKLEGIVYLTLQATKDSSSKFSDAIIAKIPENLQQVAKNFVTPIDVAFDQAIAKFAN